MVEREELELREDRLMVEREGLELREDRLTVEREELELRLGVDRLVTELRDGVRGVDLWTELDEGRRTVEREELERELTELREGAVAARPLEEADEEVEENLRIEFMAVLFFLDVVDFCVELDRDGAWEREEEKRFIILFVFELEDRSDPVLLVEDEGILLVTTERTGVVRFSLWADDLNLEGAILFACVVELLDVTDFCEFGEYLLILRADIPDFEMTPVFVLLIRLEGLLITLWFSRLELDLRIDVGLTLERALTVFSEE